MVAAAGPVIIFLCLVVLQLILGFFILSYASRCFLLVVEDTAAGNDEVTWTREPLTDWFWKLFYLLWLAGVWLCPAWLVLRFAPLPLFPDNPGLRFVVVSVGVLWLLFPVSLLSSLGAGTPAAFVYPPLLRRLVSNPGLMLRFYVSSGLLLAGAAGVFYVVMAYGWTALLLPVAALGAAAVLLSYARLLGRVARLINLRAAEEAPEPDDRKKRRKKVRSVTGAEVHDPWAVPKERPLPRKRKGGYGVKEYEPAPEKEPEIPAGEVYGVQAPPPVAPPPPPIPADEPVPETGPGRPKLEEELERREPPPPPPPWPLVTGVYTFAWRGRARNAWILLALGLLLMGAVLRVQIALSPFGGE